MQKEALENEGKRGFARLTPERRTEIAQMGGKAAHASGNAHQFSSEEAREAGKLGGQIISRNRAHMSAIGKRGGAAKRKQAS